MDLTNRMLPTHNMLATAGKPPCRRISILLRSWRQERGRSRAHPHRHLMCMAAVVHFGFSEQIEQSFLLARIQSPRHLRWLTLAL